MPPSGYSSNQSDSLTSFLGSCADALREECAAAGRPLREGFAKEVRDIDRAFVAHADSPIATATLSLTKAFYEALLGHDITDEATFSKAVTAELAAARRAVLAVHVLA